MTCLIFGYKIKKSLAVMVAAFLVGLLTHGLKNGLEFPRPSDIDIRVLPDGYRPPLQLTESGVGEGFWDFPSQEALDAAAMQADWSYGLPSGHVSAATAMFLALALFFRSRHVLWFSIGWIPLMCISRMYLGRHFLADVLGGIIVGACGVYLGYLLLRKLNKQETPRPTLRSLLPLAYLVLPIAILAPFIDLIHDENAGRILSMLVIYLFLIKYGFPSDAGKFWMRALRVLMGAGLFLVIDQLLGFIMEPGDWDDLPFGAFMRIFLSSTISFIGTVQISRKTGLYQA